jgi:hypothetical protein
MFTLVISQIFLPGVPNYLVHLLCDLVTNPEKSHFHRTGSLPLDGVVCDADGRGIVAVHGCFRLRMPHIIEDVAKNNRRLAIVVECAEFGFGRGRNNKSHDVRAYVESPV